MQYTVGQEAAISSVWGLIGDPEETYLITSGAAGTGKSEIIKKVIADFDIKRNVLSKLTGKPTPTRIIVTATSNKAVEALEEKGIEARTIQSVLGLRPIQGVLVKTKPDNIIHDTLLIVDECSFIDDPLADYIVSAVGVNTKVWFLGDPFQLPPVRYEYPIIFDEGIKTVELTEICRQANGNPIKDLSLALRNYVATGTPTTFTPDDKHIFYIEDEDDFIDLWLDSIRSGKSTKLVAHSNPVVHNANAIAKEEVEGDYRIKVGDILVCNSYVDHAVQKLKTDSQVVIKTLEPAISLGVNGYRVTVGHGVAVFVPEDPMAYKQMQEKEGKNAIEEKTLRMYWADLRPSYACTIHKSQGSTYQNVFINLSELDKLNDNHLSRLLYVAVSRASEKVYFTGEL